MGVVLCVGGQIPNDLALELDQNGVSILGTTAESIERAEDRERFGFLLDELEIPAAQVGELQVNEAGEGLLRGGRIPRDSQALARPQRVGDEGDLGKQGSRHVPRQGGGGQPQLSRHDQQVHRGRQGGRGGRHLRRGDHGDRRHNGTRREGGRPLWGRHHDHPNDNDKRGG